ncbi:MAG: hypothetical protein QXM12_01890 [Nitrososphaerota archaeon]
MPGLELDVGSVPLSSMDIHDFRVEWVVVTLNCGQDVQPALGKPTKT